MSNHLKVTAQETIRNLHQKGWSTRRISRELKLNRRTVRRYTEPKSKCTTISTPGSVGPDPSKCTTISTPGSEARSEAQCTISSPNSEPVLPTEPGVSSCKKRAGRESQCVAFAPQIAAKLALGLTAQRIHQDLAEEHAFTGSYQAVKRFVYKLRQTQPIPVVRIECQPGEEMQVDFGLGARIHADGSPKRIWRKNPAGVVVPGGFEPLAQRLQRSRNSAGHRNVRALPGERDEALRRGASHA